MLRQVKEKHILDDAVNSQNSNARGKSPRNVEREDTALVEGKDNTHSCRMIWSRAVREPDADVAPLAVLH